MPNHVISISDPRVTSTCNKVCDLSYGDSFVADEDGEDGGKRERRKRHLATEPPGLRGVRYAHVHRGPCLSAALEHKSVWENAAQLSDSNIWLISNQRAGKDRLVKARGFQCNERDMRENN